MVALLTEGSPSPAAGIWPASVYASPLAPVPTHIFVLEATDMSLDGFILTGGEGGLPEHTAFQLVLQCVQVRRVWRVRLVVACVAMWLAFWLCVCVPACVFASCQPLLAPLARRL